MRGSKKKKSSKKSNKRRSKDAKKSAKKKNGAGETSLLQQMQISSGGTASEVTVTAALKWEKLSPGEFETLQEYIQCKWAHFLFCCLLDCSWFLSLGFNECSNISTINPPKLVTQF